MWRKPVQNICRFKINNIVKNYHTPVSTPSYIFSRKYCEHIFSFFYFLLESLNSKNYDLTEFSWKISTCNLCSVTRFSCRIKIFLKSSLLTPGHTPDHTPDHRNNSSHTPDHRNKYSHTPDHRNKSSHTPDHRNKPSHYAWSEEIKSSPTPDQRKFKLVTRLIRENLI